MKKTLKITGIIIGILLIAALVIFIFFPGLPTYFKVKTEYQHINDTISDFEKVTVPSYFDTYVIKGVKLKVPYDYSLTKTESGLRSSDEKATLYVIESSPTKYTDILDEYSDEEYDPWEYYEYEEDDYRSFFAAVDDTYPDDYHASSELLWYIKDRLTAETCLKLRGRDMDVFLEFAEIKDGAWEMENVWKISGSNFSGYASENITGDYDVPFWTVNLYPEGSDNNYYFMIIRGADEGIIRQIISSIELTED